MQGADGRIPRKRSRDDDDARTAGHTLIPVYSAMLTQVCREYPGLPDPRTMTMTEIRFFYEGLRPELKKHTRPSAK